MQLYLILKFNQKILVASESYLINLTKDLNKNNVKKMGEDGT